MWWQAVGGVEDGGTAKKLGLLLKGRSCRPCMWMRRQCGSWAREALRGARSWVDMGVGAVVLIQPSPGTGEDGEGQMSAVPLLHKERGRERKLTEIMSRRRAEERLQNVPISFPYSGTDLDKSTLDGATDILNQLPTHASGTFKEERHSLLVRGVGAAARFFNGASPVAYYIYSVPFGLRQASNRSQPRRLRFGANRSSEGPTGPPLLMVQR